MDRIGERQLRARQTTKPFPSPGTKGTQIEDARARPSLLIALPLARTRTRATNRIDRIVML